jgi:hypothetical protein
MGIFTTLQQFRDHVGEAEYMIPRIRNREVFKFREFDAREMKLGMAEQGQQAHLFVLDNGFVSLVEVR